MDVKTLIVGLPGSGKTTYARKHLADGFCYDLDYLSNAFKLAVGDHEIFDQDARLFANDFLKPFLYFADKWNKDIFIIRTAPKLDEVEEIDPDKIVFCTTQFDVNDRKDFAFVSFREEDLLENIEILSLWAKDNNKTVEFYP